METRFQFKDEPDGLYLIILGVAFGPFRDRRAAEIFTRTLHCWALLASQES